jgi:hypothetical protein
MAGVAPEGDTAGVTTVPGVAALLMVLCKELKLLREVQSLHSLSGIIRLVRNYQSKQALTFFRMRSAFVLNVSSTHITSALVSTKHAHWAIHNCNCLIHTVRQFGLRINLTVGTVGQLEG